MILKMKYIAAVRYNNQASAEVLQIKMYLFEDVMKMKPQMILKGYANKNGKIIFSKIYKVFEEDEEIIFDLNLPDDKFNNAEE